MRECRSSNVLLNALLNISHVLFGNTDSSHLSLISNTSVTWLYSSAYLEPYRLDICTSSHLDIGFMCLTTFTRVLNKFKTPVDHLFAQCAQNCVFVQVCLYVVKKLQEELYGKSWHLAATCVAKHVVNVIKRASRTFINAFTVAHHRWRLTPKTRCLLNTFTFANTSSRHEHSQLDQWCIERKWKLSDIGKAIYVLPQTGEAQTHQDIPFSHEGCKRRVLDRFGIQDAKTMLTPLHDATIHREDCTIKENKNRKTLYWQIVGSLMWDAMSADQT